MDMDLKVPVTTYIELVLSAQRTVEPSPVDAVVVVWPAEELDLLESDGAGEGAGDGWVEAQERVEGRGAC